MSDQVLKDMQQQRHTVGCVVCLAILPAVAVFGQTAGVLGVQPATQKLEWLPGGLTQVDPGLSPFDLASSRRRFPPFDLHRAVGCVSVGNPFCSRTG